MPKADGQHMSVALASLIAKYLRERLMSQFNRFWTLRVPGLKPTAGYPVDARRFLDEIEPTRARLGIAIDDIWRKK
jgi:ribonuclease HII